MDKEKAKQDIKIVNKIFKKLNLPLFLMYGTALGAYRDRDFLDGDHDIDLGTWGEIHKDKIWKELEKEGFYIREGERDLKGMKDFRSIHVNRQVPFDIFLFEEYDNGIFKAFTIDDLCCATLPNTFKMETINFLGDEYLIPSPEEYLTWAYGDYKSKIKKSAR